MRRLLNGIVSLGYGVIGGLYNRLVQLVAGLAIVAATAASAEDVSIVALGDSLTAGYGLVPEAGLVPQLENWVRSQGHDVSLINAGVSGDTTAGGLARIDWVLSDNVDALIVELGANDMLRGIDPASARENLNGILAAAQARDLPILLIGFQAPGNFGPQYKEDFDSIYPELAEAYGAILMPSFFGALVEGGDAATAADYLQADGLHPNPAGVARLIEAMAPFVLELIESTRSNE